MGKVYPETVLAAGMVPVRGAHQPAGVMLLNNLYDSVPDCPVESLIVYGSTVAGTADVRSDLDIRIHVREGAEREARDLIETAFADVHQIFKVPIEATIKPAIPENTSTYDTVHDPFYAEHIVEVDNLPGSPWSRNRPSKWLLPTLIAKDDEAKTRQVAWLYCQQKADMFQAALTDYVGFADLDVLQRGLELSSSLGRKVLRAVRDPGETLPHISQKDAMRRLCREKMGRLANGDALLHYHDVVTQYDRVYSGVLQQALDGDLTTRAYSNWIEESYEPLVTCAYELSLGWADYLRCEIYRRDGGEDAPDLEALQPGMMYPTRNWEEAADFTDL